MKKILLLGSSGYIGSEFLRQLTSRGVYVCDIHHAKATPAEIYYTLTPYYDFAINVAAMVCKPSVELNDEHKAETLLGNLVFPAQLASICESTGTPLLHVSTGCLFNGHPPSATRDGFKITWPESSETRDAPFKETDEPHLTFDKGAGWYVGSKQLAETVVGRYAKSWICRTRLPFDEIDHPRNFLTKMVAFPRILDTYNSYSHRGDFVKACLDLIEVGAPYGTYNCTNPGAVWTHEIVKMMSERPGAFKSDWEYWNWDAFLKTRKTPMSNCELDCSKLLAAGVKIRPVQEALADAVKNWRKE